MSEAVIFVATVVAVLLLASCGVRERIPFPLEDQRPPSTLVRLPIPYPTSTVVVVTVAPCDLPAVICRGGPGP